MKTSLEAMLRVENPLVQTGMLTRDIFRSSYFSGEISDAVKLRVPADVYFDVKFKPHTLFAPTKSAPEGGHFRGLSCSVNPGHKLTSAQSLVRTEKYDSNINVEDLEKTDKSVDFSKRLIYCMTWKLPKGTPISSDLFNVDHDGAGHPDHVTISLARDLSSEEFFFYSGKLEVEHLAKLPWEPCEDIEVISVPSTFPELESLPPAAQYMLLEMLRRGTDEDAIAVVDLVAMLAEPDTSPAHQLRCLRIAYRTIYSFFHSDEFDHSERDGDIYPFRQALGSLIPLIIKVFRAAYL